MRLGVHSCVEISVNCHLCCWNSRQWSYQELVPNITVEERGLQADEHFVNIILICSTGDLEVPERSAQMSLFQTSDQLIQRGYGVHSQV